MSILMKFKDNTILLGVKIKTLNVYRFRKIKAGKVRNHSKIKNKKI